MSAYQTGTLIGMVTVGLLLGGFTLRQGRKLGQEALGWGGFAACVAGAFVAGLLVSGPVALLFNWLIRRAASKAPPTWPEAGPESVRR